MPGLCTPWPFTCACAQNQPWADHTRNIGAFRWASLSVPLVWPSALCEAVLLGTGQSYRFLALATLTNAFAVAQLTRWAVGVRPLPSSAWMCIFVFFV